MPVKFNSPIPRRDFLKSMAVAGFAPFVPGYAASPSPAKAFVPVMLTPFHEDRTIDYKTLDILTDFYLRAGASGLFANCLSSEMYLLEPDERLGITRAVTRRVSGNIPVVATGSFGSSAQERAEFTRRIYGEGIRAVILITSHFAAKTDDDNTFLRAMNTFLDATGNIPLGTYECPTPYKRLISPQLLEDLLKTGRFVYHKDTSENLEVIKAKLRVCKHSALGFYNAHTATAVDSLQSGGAGLSPVSGNFYPEIISWLCKNATNPDKKAEVQWIQKELAEAETVISRGYPLSAKYFLGKRGLPILPVCRAKNRTLSPEQQKALDSLHDRFKGWCGKLQVKPAV